MKNIIRPFIIEYRSKRGRSRVVRGGAPYRFAVHSAARSAARKDASDVLSAWRSLFKEEKRSP